MDIGEHGVYLEGTNRAGVLLVHGLTGTPTELHYVGRELNRAGFTVLIPQLAGHCATEEDLLGTSWPDWFGTTVEALKYLQTKVDHVFAGGLSMGAVIAIKLAALYPETVKGIALYSTTLRWDGWTISRFSFLLPLVLRLPFGRSYRFIEAPPYGIMDERLRKRIVQQMKSGDSAAAGNLGMPGTSVIQLRELVSIVKKMMPQVKTPTLVLHARNDDITSVWNANYVERHVAGPVRKIFLDNSYHMITIDQERGKVARLTIDFFNEILEKDPESSE